MLGASTRYLMFLRYAWCVCMRYLFTSWVGGSKDHEVVPVCCYTWMPCFLRIIYCVLLNRILLKADKDVIICLVFVQYDLISRMLRGIFGMTCGFRLYTVDYYHWLTYMTSMTYMIIFVYLQFVFDVCGCRWSIASDHASNAKVIWFARILIKWSTRPIF